MEHDDKTDAAEGSFAHAALETPDRALRLLRVSTDGSAIRGRLEHFELNVLPTYTALSYTWGTEIANERIFLNDRTYIVRPNLIQFLWLYASRNSDEWLWIDQICIDQSSVAERNHQVQLMSDIYRRAKTVLIWLGPQATPSPRDRECDEACASRDHQLKDPGYWSPYGRLESCSFILDLMARPYWERTWIIQEVLLAPSLMVWFISWIIPWTKLCSYFNEHKKMIRIEYSHIEFFINQRRQDDVVMDAERLVRLSCSSNCADTRDMVYGIQAVTKVFTELAGVEVDYEKPAGHVWADMALVMLMNAARTSEVGYVLGALASGMGINDGDPRYGQAWAHHFGSTDLRYLEAIVTKREYYQTISREQAIDLDWLKASVHHDLCRLASNQKFITRKVIDHDESTPEGYAWVEMGPGKSSGDVKRKRYIILQVSTGKIVALLRPYSGKAEIDVAYVGTQPRYTLVRGPNGKRQLQ